MSIPSERSTKLLSFALKLFPMVILIALKERNYIYKEYQLKE